MSKPTTFITGAARRIGAGLARHLAAKGHDLVLHYGRSGEAAEALASELRAGGTRVTLVQADLRDAAALAECWKGLPPVTHLIHNAAQFTRDTVASMTVETLRAHLAVNLEAPLFLTQGFLAQLPADAKGTVTVLGDGTKGWSVSPEFFSYGVSKLAWESVIDVLAAASAPKIRANVIALAPTLPGEGEDDAMFARLAGRSALKHSATLDDLCTVLDFVLASEAITGQVIDLAAGYGLRTFRPA